jgi:hypothetical protein
MTSLLRVTLACLAFSAAVPGLYATFSASGFYGDFPFGRGWVQMLPPYNEHLIHDVGDFYLAFTIRSHGRRGGRHSNWSSRSPRHGRSRRSCTPSTTHCTWTGSAPATRSR